MMRPIPGHPKWCLSSGVSCHGWAWFSRGGPQGGAGGPIHLQHTLQIKSLSTLAHTALCPCFCTERLWFRQTLQQGRNLWLEYQYSTTQQRANVYSMRSHIPTNIGWIDHHRSHTDSRTQTCITFWMSQSDFLIICLLRMVQESMFDWRALKSPSS